VDAQIRDRQRERLLVVREAAQILAEAIEPADGHDVEPALSRVLDHRVERRPGVLRTRDAPINVVDRLPGPGFSVTPKPT
jgi:hypothetical protein